jgi:cell division protein FtsL
MAYEQKERARAVPAVPVLKLRQLVAGILFVVVLIIWPMFMVWKQIYITDVSIKESTLADSLTRLSKEAATLRMYNEKLAGTQRIESIARAAVGLEYPTSAQIVVIRETRKDLRRQEGGNGFLAILRRTFSRERG